MTDIIPAFLLTLAAVWCQTRSLPDVFGLLQWRDRLAFVYATTLPLIIATLVLGLTVGRHFPKG